MKSPLLAKMLVLATALAITLTPGCRRKAQGPITPLPARTGNTAIENPRVSGPSGAGSDRSGAPLGDRSGTRGSDLGGPGANGADGGSKAVNPQENLPLAGGPLDRSAFNENRGQFANDTVYFDFDSSVIKTSEKAKIATVADYLKSNATAAVEIEGHCDERGTEEYNRSLGERRALAIREELAQKGIDPKRIYTISYGEDRPAVNGHDDTAWSKNRRGEFVLLTPR